MFKEINKKYMLMCIFVALTFVLCPFICNNYINIYARTPLEALNDCNNDNLLLINTYYFFEHNKDELAIAEFEKINFECLKINLFNKEFFNIVLEKYQKIIIEKAKQFELKKQYKNAVEFLETKTNFFSNKHLINSLIEKYKNYYVEAGLVKYDGPVEHFFTHCLIAYPEIAFNENNFMRKDYDRDCLTPNEFKAILENFYKNNYILISANSCFENIKTNIVKKTLFLPKNKKPLILSFDDVNYDSKKSNRGMVDKIVVDSNNELCAFTQKNGIDKQLTYDNEFIPILEQFVKEHPDFSFKGAKGLLCLTGYDGILGYRINKESIIKEQEIDKVKKVICALKEKGWEFACHSYGHYHMKNISNEKFEEEINCWQNEIAPLIGKTKIYVYPYGENQILNSNNSVNFKHQLLLNAGFELFCGVGSNYFFNYYPFNSENAVLFMDRRPLDGQSLRTKKIAYQKFFDCEKIYDNSNRYIPY